MKGIYVFLTIFSFTAYAQPIDGNAFKSIRVGAGYTREFPGLDGYTFSGEFLHDMTFNLQGAFGFKRVNVSGYPRSAKIKEFTKATTLDFNLYFLPVRKGNHIVRLGGGYSFSLYNTRRSYPVIDRVSPGSETTSFNVQDNKGRVSGFTLASEYEYIIPYSSFSLGARASMFKAYTRVIYIGPYAAIRF